MNALEVRNLSKSFKDFALQNLTFSIPFGSALGLIGENGAGKSTTIALILGLLQPDAGQISILGQSLSQSIDLKEDIGTVFDEACFPDGINARQADRIEALLYKNWSSETYFDYIQRFNLPETKAFKAYSRGMKMKLALAVALSHNAKILLLDEATGGLDPLA